jgi:lipid-A-disaccharide synthase
MSTPKHIRPLSKLAAESDLRGEAERRTAVYMSVHEDSSTVSTKQIASAEEFRKKSIVIVAGEASGDMHAASFVRQLKSTQPELEFSGIGGSHMQAAGVSLLSDLARYGVTGLTEILRHAGAIRQAFKLIKKHLQTIKPDLLILVDYPGFNLRLARYAKQHLGLRVLYYISPQIWAWKASRIKIIQANVDHMAVILPFEKKIYLEAKVPVSFVGHPLSEKMAQLVDDKARQRAQLNIPSGKRLIAMLPGSRINEIKRLMPVLIETAKRLHRQNPDVHFLIPVASNLPMDTVSRYFKQCKLPHRLFEGQALEVLSASDCAVVASGTASLECALLAKPMCIIYKGSLLSYALAFKLIKVYYFGLCNLLQNKMIVPELLQYDCNPKELCKTLNALLYDSKQIKRMQRDLQVLKQSLSSEQADCSIEELILELLD